MLTNMTVKGQVTVPKDVRDTLGLRPGEAVEFAWNRAGEVVIRRPLQEPPVDPALYNARLKRFEAAAEEWKHLRTGRSTESYMAELREPLPEPDPADL